MRKWIFIFSDLLHVSTKSRCGSGCNVFRVLWSTQKERCLLLTESCRGIICLLRTNNFIMVLGSEVACESPWHITLHSFSSNERFLGENQKKLFSLCSGQWCILPQTMVTGVSGKRSKPGITLGDLWLTLREAGKPLQNPENTVPLHSIPFHPCPIPLPLPTVRVPTHSPRPFHARPLLLLLMKAVCVRESWTEN